MSRVRKSSVVRFQQSPRFEVLEGRLLYATRVWDGGAALNDNWSEPKNWVNDVAPKAGDDLVFPPGILATDRSTRNDFPEGRKFNSITIQGFGYTLRGNRILVGTGGIKGALTGEFNSSPNTIKLDVTISNGSSTAPTQTPFVVLGNSPDLIFDNVINGFSGITKTGGGKIVFTGRNLNSYGGVTEVRDGILELSKDSGIIGGLAFAIPHDLVITKAPEALTAPRVIAAKSQQFHRFADVTLNGGRLEIRGFEEVGDLTMSGGEVFGTGRLIVGEEGFPIHQLITQPPVAGASNAKIRTQFLDLFVADVTTNAPLGIESEIDNGGITKNGLSSLALRGPTGNRFQSVLTLNEGELRLGKAAGQIAFGGDLFAFRNSRIVLENSNQIFDQSRLHLNLGPTLDFGPFSDTIGELQLGGTVKSSAIGVITLSEDVTVSNSPAGTPAVLAGRVSLGNEVRTFDVLGGDFNLSAVISGNQDLVKKGTGAMFISGTSNFSGRLVLDEGFMIVNGQLFNSRATVNGGLLSGTGRIGDIAADAGVVNPGPTPGNSATTGLLQAGGFTLLGTSLLHIDLAGATPGTQFDQIRTTTSDPTRLLLGGTLEVRLPSTFTPTIGQNFRIIDNFGSVPVFAGVFLRDTQGHLLDHDGATFNATNGMTFAINYHGGTGNDVVITRVAAPAAVAFGKVTIAATASTDGPATEDLVTDVLGAGEAM